jgi:hypothetical protein
MQGKTRPTESQIKVYETPQAMQALRAGGESRPFEYPHLYQIQAGDWRISYAVEHDRLAILVLEVLTRDGLVRKDPASEKLARKMKIKLLDWPEGSPSRDLPPEELGKKLKIKLLDLADEMGQEEAADAPRRSKIKLSGAAAKKPRNRRITLLDPAQAAMDQAPSEQASAGETAPVERKVTPVDAPTM